MVGARPTEPVPTNPAENTEQEEVSFQILPEYAQLHEMNSDMVGWITIEGTKNDYSVMQRKDGSMFRDLLLYDRRSFYQNHPTITFNTLYEHHTYQIIAAFKTTAAAGGFRFHQFNDAANAEEFNEYVAQCKELSLYETGFDAVCGDRFITLATCEYSQNEGRLVVVAKQVS